MSGSWKRTDYSLRPAKHAERRILLEIFRRLRPFRPVENYPYIGMGSLWFADFNLFHRVLGIRDMISIEGSPGASSERFEANKPFSCITIDYRKTWEVLPELKWDQPYLMWLDYDAPLSVEILSDIRTVAAHAHPGTAFAISIQCHKAPDVAKAEEEAGGLLPIQRFRERFGPERVGQSVSEEDLYGWPFGRLSREMIYAEIDSALAVRNSANLHDPISFSRVCDIEYEDGAKMTTVVGVFAAGPDDGRVAECCFSELDFLVGVEGAVRIQVPVLTLREIRLLERQLPRGPDAAMEIGHIPETDAKRFSQMYRYFPNFAVLET